jgi:hypothetical protein
MCRLVCIHFKPLGDVLQCQVRPFDCPRGQFPTLTPFLTTTHTARHGTTHTAHTARHGTTYGTCTLQWQNEWARAASLAAKGTPLAQCRSDPKKSSSLVSDLAPTAIEEGHVAEASHIGVVESEAWDNWMADSDPPDAVRAPLCVVCRVCCVPCVPCVPRVLRVAALLTALAGRGLRRDQSRGALSAIIQQHAVRRQGSPGERAPSNLSRTVMVHDDDCRV